MVPPPAFGKRAAKTCGICYELAHGDDPGAVQAGLPQNVLTHEYYVIGIESNSRPYLSVEKRVIIDADLCEIS